mgnify:CR=1 FL=1
MKTTLTSIFALALCIGTAAAQAVGETEMKVALSQNDGSEVLATVGENKVTLGDAALTYSTLPEQMRGSEPAKMLEAITEQLQTVNNNLNQLTQESQQSTGQQITQASASILTMISSGAVVIPLSIIFCFVMGLSIQRLIKAPLKQLIITLKRLAEGYVCTYVLLQKANLP